MTESPGKPWYVLAKERGEELPKRARQPEEPVPRERWQLRPLEGVGPLTFGMTLGEVTEILGEPKHRMEDRDGRLHLQQVTFPISVTVFFSTEAKLACVKFDALRGPELAYNGELLTGRVPSELNALLQAWAEQNDWLVRYSPRGEPSEYEEIGLMMLVQRDADRLVSRPLAYGQPWIDDDPFAHDPSGTERLLGLNEW